jgi:hypothetical protein
VSTTCPQFTSARCGIDIASIKSRTAKKSDGPAIRIANASLQAAPCLTAVQKAVNSGLANLDAAKKIDLKGFDVATSCGNDKLLPRIAQGVAQEKALNIVLYATRLNRGKLKRMTAEEIVDVLRANSGKRLRVTFGDGVVESILIGSVDGEGFVHSGPDGESPHSFWTRIEDVRLLETENSN